MRKQAESFGAEFLLAEVTGLDLSGRHGQDCHAPAGAISEVLRCPAGPPAPTPAWWAFQGEEAVPGPGRGLLRHLRRRILHRSRMSSWWAAASLRRRRAVFLTKYARHVTILIRGEDFTCAQATADDMARSHEKITVLTNTEVEEVSGDTALRLSPLSEHGNRPGDRSTSAADGETFGVFVFAGYQPATELVQGLAEAGRPGLRPHGPEPADHRRPVSTPPETYVSEAPAPGCHRRGRRRPGRHGAGKHAARLPCRPRTCASAAPASTAAAGHPRRAVLRTRRAKQLPAVLPPGRCWPSSTPSSAAWPPPWCCELTLNETPPSPQELAGYMEALCGPQPTSSP